MNVTSFMHYVHLYVSRMLLTWLHHGTLFFLLGPRDLTGQYGFGELWQTWSNSVRHGTSRSERNPTKGAHIVVFSGFVCHRLGSFVARLEQNGGICRHAACVRAADAMLSGYFIPFLLSWLASFTAPYVCATCVWCPCCEQRGLLCTRGENAFWVM